MDMAGLFSLRVSEYDQYVVGGGWGKEDYCDHLFIDGKEKQQGHTGLRDHGKELRVQAKHIMELVVHFHPQIGHILSK